MPPSDDFKPASLPPDALKLDTGVFRSENTKSQPVLWVLFNADPSRNNEWEIDGRKNAHSKAAWQREQWIDFQAGGGELVLRELLERKWNEIIITDPKQIPWDELSYGAGLDYGKTHFGTFVASGIDRLGCKYSVLEHGGTNMTPSTHAREIKQRRLPPFGEGSAPLVLSKVISTYYDPSMDVENIARDDAFTSNIKLFVNAGMPHLRKGHRGLDLLLLDEIIDAWESSPVRYKIFCPKEIGSRRPTHPQWQGCANLVWELKNARRKENSATREQTVGAAEGLVDKDNDFWDALKYWWTASPATPTQSKEEKWRKTAEHLKEVNPAMDLNSLIMYAKKFEKENPQKVLSYR